ncbi:WD40 repeat domain-containing protein [Naegleria gruberi]|uniref:WD40 repeat domain-containing protein n=1 Tax=Naegleria gruberi TaxID=5762 RepID=D2W4E6_NAEGR|nr:WD40 repeat domain-containing protein [Naegleria gruberi]EFC36054.1 WD40 repeat domain-containing protein [Naegleria gruberi]|eukprot:XP_002668798.1 WD40 repeat domain-containing protein [Naegleria gruberi strain NEG-M]
MTSSNSVIYPRFLKAAHFPPTNYEEMMVDKLPSKKLELEFIHGASKKGCKGCYFHINDENKLVYPSAACGIVYDPINNTQSVFRKHDDDVVTIAKHPNEYIFASGQIGKDDMIYIWDSHDIKEPITKLDTHLHFKNGGVLATSFSNSGELLVTVGGNDTSSIILLYNWKKNELIASTKCLSSEIFDLQFSPDDSQIYICGKKVLKIYNTKDLTFKSGIFGSKGTLQNLHSLCFNMKNQDAYVGCEDGSIYLFRDGKLINTINGHHGNVFTLYPLYDKNSKFNYGFISGGKDGQVKYWKFNNSFIECYKSITINGFVKNITHSKYDNNVYASKANGDLYLIKENGEIELLLISHFGTMLKQLWGLDTFKELPLFVTCSDDGRVIVWNCENRKHASLLKLNSSLELRGVCVSPSNEHVAFTSKEGHLFIYGFNLENYTFTEEPLYTRKDSNEEITTLSYNHDGTLLAVGSHDNYIYLYNCLKSGSGDYKYIGKLIGHSSFITHLDISKCGNYLKSNSGDYEILLWDLNSKKLSNCSNIENIEWNSMTCPLGWTVRGIWKQDFNGTDVNTCHVDYENELIIVGEDTTMLSLYHYPCPIIKPFGYSYIGHCSHVTNVKFIHYNIENERITKLLSCGGGDLTIFQWNLIDNNDQLDQLNTSTALPSLKMDSMIGGGLYNPKSPRGQSANLLDSMNQKSPRGISTTTTCTPGQNEANELYNPNVIFGNFISTSEYHGFL